MLGVYESFPENVHKIVNFAASIPTKRLQQILIQEVRRLNETAGLNGLQDSAVSQCAVIFEIGIAEGGDFNYLDDEEESKVISVVSKKALSAMDFLLVIRYYRMREQKRSPLRFDYYMLRLTFGGCLEIRVFHEKGPMRMLPVDVIELIVDRINGTASKRILRPLET